ncbi:MAG: DUF4097 family beta strand repeat protein [Lachnospiraceae bacterium]|nr:DUF4097 family beta strand repeat protein [Lachnospiraceae bacterium]
MKKSTLFSLIAVGVGIILIGLSILLVGGNFRKFGAKKAGAGQNYIYHKYECTSDITALDVKELYETAVITTGSVDKPVVEYYEYENHDYVEVSESNGKLSYERIEKKTGANIHFWFEFDMSQDTKTVITLPKNFEGPVDATCTSGALKISNLKNSTIVAKTSSGSASVENIEKSGSVSVKATSGSTKVINVNSDGNVTVETNSGLVKAEDIKCADLYCHATSGSVKVTDIECANADIGCSSGSVHSENVKSSDDIKASTTSGSIKLETLTCKNLSTESGSGSTRYNGATVDTVSSRTTSGSIRFDNLKINKSGEFKSSSGSISGNIDDKESDFSIISSTTSGSSNLNSSREGSKNLDASTTSGMIHIDFNH